MNKCVGRCVEPGQRPARWRYVKSHVVQAHSTAREMGEMGYEFSQERINSIRACN